MRDSPVADIRPPDLEICEIGQTGQLFALFVVKRAFGQIDRNHSSIQSCPSSSSLPDGIDSRLFAFRLSRPILFTRLLAAVLFSAGDAWGIGYRRILWTIGWATDHQEYQYQPGTSLDETRRNHDGLTLRQITLATTLTAGVATADRQHRLKAASKISGAAPPRQRPPADRRMTAKRPGRPVVAVPPLVLLFPAC